MACHAAVVFFTVDNNNSSAEIPQKMIDWVPVVFVAFKALIFGACMFFAIKWHYDQGKKKGVETRALLLTMGKVAAVFVLALLGVLTFTFGIAKMLGMDLSLP